MGLQCKYCEALIPPGTYYCSNCGKVLNDPPFTISTAKIIWLSIISILLPPFGLIPGIKYMLKNDSRATMAGLLMIILTFLSLAVTIYFLMQMLNGISSQYSQINQTIVDPNQVNQIQQTNDQLQNLNP